MKLSVKLCCLLFFFFSSQVLADKLEKDLSACHIFDYFKAKEYFEESLESKTPGASLD